MTKLTSLATACLFLFDVHTSAAKDLSVADAIEMVRIQYKATERGEVAAISPSGKFAAVVTWRGSLATNRNTFTLLLVDLAGAEPPRQLVSFEFTNDPHDQSASPIRSVAFVGSGDRIAFLGRAGDRPAQVYLVETVTKNVSRLTNHQTAVRSFVLDANANLRAFSAEGAVDVAALDRRLQADGVFVADRSVFPFAQRSIVATAPLVSPSLRAGREYFLAGRSKAFFDSLSSRPKLPKAIDENEPITLEYDWILNGIGEFVGDPLGQHALLFPYAFADHDLQTERYAFYKDRSETKLHLEAPYGLVDLRTGRTEVLLNAPSPASSGRAPAFWSPDSQSIALFGLNPATPNSPPAWLEVAVRSRRVTPLNVPDGWTARGFLDSGQTILLQKDNEFAKIRRGADGRWQGLQILRRAGSFNSDWTLATNGSLLVGVSDAPVSAPELTTFDLETGATRSLTRLNPWLESKRLSVPEELFLGDGGRRRSAGFLIKPANYQTGQRYPLVLLFDDGTLGRSKTPFLFDAAWQLNGHAIQMLSDQGFAVFYLRDPPFDDGAETTAEGAKVVKHLTSVVEELDKKGLADTRRLGLSGWSRAGYYTHYALMHAGIRFAAATSMDGGAREYNDGLRPFTDEELKAITAPLLHEAYGMASLVLWGEMADRMIAKGQPVETVFYQTSAHSTVRPRHRLRSLQTHIDWWKFWLMGQEDQAAISAAQYPRWRQMRTRQCERLTGSNAPWYCAR